SAIYPLPLHDALPICREKRGDAASRVQPRTFDQEPAGLDPIAEALRKIGSRELPAAMADSDFRLKRHRHAALHGAPDEIGVLPRSEEHTSELQSLTNL